MKLFHLIIACILTAQIALADLYISSSGSDTNPGTHEAPFRTIQKAADLAEPGDTVWIGPGVYRETIRPANSGTSEAPITYRSWSSFEGEQAILTGTDKVDGAWTQVNSSNVYWTPWIGEYRSEVDQSDQVFANGQMLNLLRWPKETNGDLTYPIEAYVDTLDWSDLPNTIVTESEWDQPDGRWNGAEVWVNLSNIRDGQGQSGKIVTTDLEKKQVTWTRIDTRGAGATGPEPWVVYPGTAFYLFNPTPEGISATGGIEAAIGENEWWVDHSAGRLYIRLSGEAVPADHLIEVKRRDWAFNFVDRSHITVRDLRLFAASITSDPAPTVAAVGQIVASASNLLLDNLLVEYVTHFTDQSGEYQMQWAAQSGLILSGTGHVVRNCKFRWSAGSAISILGRDHRIYNNLFEDIGYLVTEAGFINTGKWESITEDVKIGYNTLRRSAGLGISIRELENSDPGKPGLARVHHNHIHDIMRRVRDAGAIDTAYTDGHWIRIDHNLIHGMPEEILFGVYLDFGIITAEGEDQMRYLVDHNVIFDVWSPIGGNGYNTVIILNNVALNNDGDWLGGIASVNNNRELIDVQLYNNISSGTAFWPSPEVHDSNLRRLTSATLSNYFVDPDAVDPLQKDFQLKNDAVGPIDGGVFVPPWDDPVENGFIDIGAFEFGRAKWEAGYGKIPFYLDTEDSLRRTAQGGEISGHFVLHPFGNHESVQQLSVTATSPGLLVDLGGETLSPDESIAVSVTAATESPVGSGWFEVQGVTESGVWHRQTITLEVLPEQTISYITIDDASEGPWILKPGTVYMLNVTAFDMNDQQVVVKPNYEWRTTGGGVLGDDGILTTFSIQSGPHTVTVSAGGVEATQVFTVAENWAKRGTVTVSSELNSNTGAEKAVDDSTSTLWVSERSDPQWIQIDMQESISVSSVVLLWHNFNYAADYSIETSIDGSNWTTILEVTGNVAEDLPVKHDFSDVPPSRFIRVTGKNRPSSTAAYGIRNLAIYGKRLSDVEPILVEGEWSNNFFLGWAFGYSGSWAWSLDVGFVYYGYWPWVYQSSHGWLYFVGSDGLTTIYYSPELGWLSLVDGTNGYYYLFSTGNWGNFLQ